MAQLTKVHLARRYPDFHNANKWVGVVSLPQDGLLTHPWIAPFSPPPSLKHLIRQCIEALRKEVHHAKTQWNKHTCIRCQFNPGYLICHWSLVPLSINHYITLKLLVVLWNTVQYNTIQYNNLFAFPFEIRLKEIYIYFLFYVKMLSNFEIIYSLGRKCLVPKWTLRFLEFSPRLAML